MNAFTPNDVSLAVDRKVSAPAEVARQHHGSHRRLLDERDGIRVGILIRARSAHQLDSVGPALSRSHSEALEDIFESSKENLGK